MKIKNKGKVYPTPSSSSSSSSPPPPPPSQHTDGDFLSVLKLLPAAILALASVLSLEDREVLAYMITRSMKTTTPSSLLPESKKKPSKKAQNSGNGGGGGGSGGTATHKPPMFDCDCFDCYTSYWFRWDSSPNRELIHQAIEAFEDQLTNGEKSKKNTGRGKRREKMVRRDSEKPTHVPLQAQPEVPLPETNESCAVLVPSGDTTATISSPLNTVRVEVSNAKEEEEKLAEVTGEVVETEDNKAIVVQTSAANSHKGLARKVLPDVLGLFNSRLWSLWNPHV